MKADLPTDLAGRVAQALAAMGVPAQRRPAAGGACTLRVGPKGHAVDYAVVLQPQLARATLGAALMQARQLAIKGGHAPLLVAEYVTPPVADDLQAQGQPFADAAGNAWLPACDVGVAATMTYRPVVASLHHNTIRELPE